MSKSSILSFLKEKIDLISLFLCALFAGFWMIIVAQRYYYFAYGTSWDPAYHAQNIWALLHASMSPSILHANFISNHCTFLCFLIAPLYWISPDPMLLQYLKITGFFVGAYVFFLILKKRFHPMLALGAMIAFILAPVNCSMLYSAFNYEPFAIPLFFLIFKAFDENKFWPYIICCFLLAMVKEQMPLVVAMFGVFALLFKKEKKIRWAMVPIVMGLIIFAVEVFILTPYVRKDMPCAQSFFWARYMRFGKTPLEIISFLITHPWQVLKQFVSPEITHWYNNLFGIWGGLAFLSPHILLIALPLFLKTILSSDSQEHIVSWSYQTYYASTFTPFIFLAAWNTLNHIQGKWRLNLHLLALAIMLIQAFIFIPMWLASSHPVINNNALARQRFLDRIPPDASVLSGWTTLAPLANRKGLYTVESYLNGSYYVSGQKFEFPKDVDYLLLDFADEIIVNNNNKKYIPKITALNFDDRWRLQESIEDIALYVKDPSRQKADRLIEKSFKPFQIKNTASQIFDHTIALEAIEFPKVLPQKYRIFPINMYWKCLKKTKTPYDILINITSPAGKSCYIKQRPIGSTIYPTYFWKKGEHVRESYFYLLPPMPLGNFDIKISFYNTVSKKWVRKIEKNFSVS